MSSTFITSCATHSTLDCTKVSFDSNSVQLFFCFQKFFDKHDKDKDGLIDFAEFVKYVTDHERKLRLYFKKIDTNDDGELSVIEKDRQPGDIDYQCYPPCRKTHKDIIYGSVINNNY